MEGGIPDYDGISDDSDASDSTFCASATDSESSGLRTDDEDEEEVVVTVETFSGSAPSPPRRGLRKGAPAQVVQPGAHVLSHVRKGEKHKCGLCGKWAQIYCAQCTKFLCFNSSRNCYHDHHFGAPK